MQYITLQQTNLTVSRLCLGTMHYGDKQNAMEASTQLNAFLDYGGTFIDTAHVYGRWVPNLGSSSETYIGEWIRKSGKRHHIILSTKGCHPALDNRSVSRVLPENIHSDLSESLAHLQTDYIDLYFLHRDNPSCPVELIVEALEAEVQAGRIRYYGCSNWKPERIQEANAYAHSIGAKGFVVNQAMLSLADISWAGVEDKTLEAVDRSTLVFQREAHMDLMAYSSIAKGYFSKIFLGEKQRPLDVAVYGNSSNNRIYQTLKPYLNEFLPIDIELQFLFSFVDPRVVPIVSFSSESQLKQGIHAEQLVVPKDLIDKLLVMKTYVQR